MLAYIYRKWLWFHRVFEMVLPDIYPLVCVHFKRVKVPLPDQIRALAPTFLYGTCLPVGGELSHLEESGT